jgi:predicted Zn-dependent peptidase
MYRKDTLANGIRVVSETLPKSRALSIGVWVKVGSRHEPDEISGVSHFIEHMFFKGTQKRTARDIATEIESLGGEMNAFTSQENTTYYVKVLDEHLPVAVDILADILIGSRFDAAEMEKERKVILEEIKMVEDTPDDYIHELFTGSVWQGNALGRPILGTKETIKALKHKDILSYIDRYYSPREIIIAVAGNFEHEKLIELLNRAFGSLERTGTAKEESAPGFRRAISVRKKQLEQAQLCLGCRGLNYVNDDRYTILALNTVLGNGMSSRLFQEVREQNALAYSIYSYVTAYRDAGLLTVYAGADPANVVDAVRLIVKEIRKIRDEGITQAEETRVKNQIKGNLVLSLESSNSHMSRLARQEIYFGKYFSMDDVIKAVDRITADDIHRVARQIFTRETIALSILGPLTKADIPEDILDI